MVDSTISLLWGLGEFQDFPPLNLKKEIRAVCDNLIKGNFTGKKNILAGSLAVNVIEPVRMSSRLLNVREGDIHAGLFALNVSDPARLSLLMTNQRLN